MVNLLVVNGPRGKGALAEAALHPVRGLVEPLAVGRLRVRLFLVELDLPVAMLAELVIVELSLVWNKSGNREMHLGPQINLTLIWSESTT